MTARLIPSDTVQRKMRPVRTDDGWWLPCLVAAESSFVLAMIVVAHLAVTAALVCATSASALAVGSVYARPIMVQIGTRLSAKTQRVPTNPSPAERASGLPQLAVLVPLELGVVCAGVLLARLSTSEAIRMAAGITILCTAICQGRPALLAFGRRMFL